MKYRSVASIVVLLLGTRLVHIGCVSVTTPPQTLNQTSSSLDLAAPDPRFRVIAKYGETSLPVTSCYINTLDLMAILAAKDYNGKIRETNGPVVAGYTNVVIEIKPHLPAETLFTKFAILGLYYGITAMTRDNVWKVAVFGILWEGEHVGWIWLQTPDSNGGNQSELQHLQDQMQNLTGEALSEALIDLNNTSATVPPETLPHSKKPNNSNVSTSTANASNSDFELFMSFYPHGTPLYPAQVFLPVISALKEVAKYDVNDDVIPFRVRIPEVRGNIQWDYPNGDKLNGPPSFEYKWIIEAARQIPRWMLERRFAESFFTIAVNDHVIGRGDIYSGRVPGLGMGDVATS